MHVECAVLAEVAERGGVDAPGAAACAVRAVPPRMRNIYLHAYQSYLWNCAASLRLERYGDAVVAGDLVLAATDGAAADAGCDGDAAEPVASAGAGGAGAGASSSAAASAASDALPAVHVVTAGDVAAGRYSLTDVVLPMVGFAVAYPQLEGLDAPAVHAMLVKDGIVAAAAAAAPSAPSAAATAQEPAAAGAGAPAAPCAAASGMTVASAEGALRSLFNHRDSVYRVSGAYRKLVTAAQGVEWAFLRYSDPEAQLALTDSDELPAGTAPRTIPPIPLRDREALTQRPAGSDSSSSSGGGSSAAAYVTGEGRHLALRISFTLPKSAYATMLMREIMRDEAAAAAAE
jgi:tRNA pseudouridine13 synthase